MTLLQSILLGLIEGFTEFLPISSTAHLIVAQKFLGLSQINEFFTTVVQMGAVLAVVAYFYSSILKLSFKKIMALLLASLPVLGIGFLLRHQIANLHSSIPLIAFTSIAIGIVLAISQWYSKNQKKKNSVSTKSLVKMGLWQVIALLPGASRSGSVIAGGLFAGISFDDALKYSFLLSIPALLVAGGYELFTSLGNGIPQNIITSTAVGTLAAFLSALISIKFLITSVRKLGFTPFVIYRILFGILILILLKDGVSSSTEADLPNPSPSAILRPAPSFTTVLGQRTKSANCNIANGLPDHEFDHLIPLELGGNPSDQANLWPEPYNIPLGAREKDKMENYLHALVCKGAVTLSQAQFEIANDWVSIYKQIK
jgi:undecaprenyl-diphosphatase